MSPDVMPHIKSLAQQILPKDGSLWLYGSRARGDYHEDSDWDLLILLNQDQQTLQDFDKYAYPFVEMGWKHNTTISPMIYTRQEWQARSFTPFYHNVQQDKIVLQ